ncbi:MAG: RNA polymerase sigma factor [Clostridia bacterium]|nr:RNA polymerase sigma factor [Clostridia bacterium]
MLYSGNIKSKFDSFEQMVNPFYNNLYRYIFLILRNEYAAEDVLQNTLIKAFKNLDSLKDESKFKNWIFTIAKNESMSWIKKHKKYVAVEENTLEFISKNEDYYLPEDFIIREETKKIVIDIINSLEPKYRDVIILKYYNRLTENEISKVLNIKRGTVKSRHKRAKDQIYKKLIANRYVNNKNEG